MINVLSLFDGISAGRLALFRAEIPVKNYYKAEIDKFPSLVSSTHYPDDINFGDVTKWREWDIDWKSIDLVLGGFPCFTAGTLVTTSKGLVKIEDIKTGDLVMTHTHTFKPVVIPMRKVADHYNIVKIQGSHELRVTDEHPFYVRKMKHSFSNIKRTQIRSFSEPSWVDCKDLQKNDFIGVPLNQKNIVPEFSSDLDFWYMVGRYVADGYSSTENLQQRGGGKTRRVYKTIITCGKHEEVICDRILNKTSYNFCKSIERTSIKYTISNKDLWFFIQNFKRGAENKEIPSFLFDAPKDIIKSFINGYVSGDGCFINNSKPKGNKDTIQITTVSEKLAYGVIQLIQKAYNVQPSIVKNKVAPTTTIEGRVVNQKPFYIVRFKYYKDKFSKYFEENGFIWTPFKSRVRVEEAVPVFNFEVEEDNSYCVNNLIVHNCQAWSLAGKQLGDKDPRGMLFWVTLDILKHIQTLNPNVKFLLENVKMKKEFEEYITRHTTEALGVVHKILINSALVSAQNRNRFYWTNWVNTQPEPLETYVKDILEENPDKRYELSDEAIAYMSRLRNGKPRWEYHKNPLDGKAACLTANMFKGIPYGVLQIKCGAFRGRYKINGVRQDAKMKTAGLTSQELEIRQDGKTNCLTTVQKDNVAVFEIPEDNRMFYRRLTPIECARLQTFPDQWCSMLSPTQQYKAYGNSWTVDVVAHLFRALKNQGDPFC